MEEKKEIKFNLAVLGKNKTLKNSPVYGCLKGGKTPTLRQTRSVANPVPTLVPNPRIPDKKRDRTIKHYTTFGKRNQSIRVLIKNKKEFQCINNEIRKLEKHSLADVCTYLAARNLYTPGSNAPEEVLREIYKNAYLAGNVENSNPETLLDNFLQA